jgi:heme-degrading monooxygenase HmoA
MSSEVDLLSKMTRRAFIQSGSTTTAATAISALKGPETEPEQQRNSYAVVFEVRTTAETQAAYLETAKRLRPMLDHIPGFLSIERSVSLSQEHTILSLSHWADEAALVQWRSTGEHHAAQQQGRDSIFADYRLRVGPVIRPSILDGGLIRESVHSYNVPPFHPRQFMAIACGDGLEKAELIEKGLAQISVKQQGGHAYRSLADPRRYFVTLPLSSLSESSELSQTCKEAFRLDLAKERASLNLQFIEVERDYGMQVREQAPQFFPSKENLKKEERSDESN